MKRIRVRDSLIREKQKTKWGIWKEETIAINRRVKEKKASRRVSIKNTRNFTKKERRHWTDKERRVSKEKSRNRGWAKIKMRSITKRCWENSWCAEVVIKIKTSRELKC